MRSNLTEKPFENAPASRKDLVDQSYRSGQNGDSKTRSGDSSCAAPGIHLLTKGLKSYSLIESALLAGARKNRDGLQHIITMIDTEAKQLQVISDLYRIIKAQPKYRTLKEPSWSGQTPPITVIMWLLKKLGPLANGDTWTIDTYGNGKISRYRFVIFRRYHRQELSPNEQFISLDFLPHLIKRDRPLHDMIIDAIALTSRCNKIPLWDQDGDYSSALKLFLSKVNIKGLSRDSKVKAQYLSYKSGVARKYLQLIKRRRKNVTSAALSKAIGEYSRTIKAPGYRKRDMVYWLKGAITLAKTGKNISRESFLPGYIPGRPIGPYRLYKFVWSVSSDDAVASRTGKAMDQDRDSFGLYPPVRFQTTYPGEKVKPLDSPGLGGFNYRKGDFQLSLYSFMEQGFSHFYHRFRDYYIKERPRKSSPLLLDIISESELQNEIEIGV
jgi:hypothetical protein